MIRRDDYKVDHEYRFTRTTRRTWYDRFRDAMDYVPYLALSVSLFVAAMYAGGAFGGDFEGDMNRLLDGEFWEEDDEIAAKWVYVKSLFRPSTWFQE